MKQSLNEALADFLDEAKDEFANHGCNDAELPKNDECLDFFEQMLFWGDGGELDEDSKEDFARANSSKGPIYTYDWMIFGTLAQMFRYGQIT